MKNKLQFDVFLNSSSDSDPPTNKSKSSDRDPPIFSPTLKNVTLHENIIGIENTNSSLHASIPPIIFTGLSAISTLALIYFFTKHPEKGRSTPLPGYGIIGDKVNELIELFLDALTVSVYNDNKWECQRRMLCEANQRANEYGIFQGVLMYFLSLGVSFLLQNEKVSESLEAMKFGRKGVDCAQIYQKCPYKL